MSMDNRSGLCADVATRWYRAPEIMLSFANYVSGNFRDGDPCENLLMQVRPYISLHRPLVVRYLSPVWLI